MPARNISTAPVRRVAAPDARRPELRVVSTEAERAIRHRRRPHNLLSVLAVAVLFGSLLAVVVGHAMLVQGQVRLSAVQAQLSAEQVVNRQDVLALASLETPSRIVADAEQKLGMVEPGQVTQLPWVPLDAPIATPKVAAVSPSTSPTAGANAGVSSQAAAPTPSGPAPTSTSLR